MARNKPRHSTNPQRTPRHNTRHRQQATRPRRRNHIPQPTLIHRRRHRRNISTRLTVDTTRTTQHPVPGRMPNGRTRRIHTPRIQQPTPQPHTGRSRSRHDSIIKPRRTPHSNKPPARKLHTTPEPTTPKPAPTRITNRTRTRLLRRRSRIRITTTTTPARHRTPARTPAPQRQLPHRSSHKTRHTRSHNRRH